MFFAELHTTGGASSVPGPVRDSGPPGAAQHHLQVGGRADHLQSVHQLQPAHHPLQHAAERPEAGVLPDQAGHQVRQLPAHRTDQGGPDRHNQVGGLSSIRF